MDSTAETHPGVGHALLRAAGTWRLGQMKCWVQAAPAGQLPAELAEALSVLHCNLILLPNPTSFPIPSLV